MDRRRRHRNDAENIEEVPSSSSASYHTAVPPEPSSLISCLAFLWSLISSPFYKTEISTLSLFHLICTLAIGISLSIATEILEAKNITKSCLYYFLIIYMLISIGWIIGAFCCGKKSGCCLAQRQLDDHIPGYLIIGVTFLCIGSSFITAVEFLPFAFSKACNKSKINITDEVKEKMENELTSEAIFALTKFVFLILQLYFFCRFSSKTFLDTCCMRIFLMHIIAVNLCTWFYIIVDESVDHEQRGTRFQTFTKNCPPFKTIDDIREQMDGFLYPFNIEYSVMSSVLLFLLWFRLIKSNDPLPRPEARESPENEPHQRNTCWQRLKIFFFDKCCKEGIPQGEKTPISFWRSAICGYVLGVVILIVILLIVIVLGIEFRDAQASAVYSYLGTRISIYLLMSLVCLFGLKYLREHDPVDQTHHIIVDSALIMIGVSGCYLYVGLDITATANDYLSCNNTETHNETLNPETNLSCTFLRVTFADCAFALIEFTLQAFFIVRALRRSSLVPRCSPDALSSKTGKISSALVVRRCSAFLSIANMGMWAMDTFELEQIQEAEVPEIRAYTKNSWLILSHVAYPLCIFFRLHSVFCCFEIVINRFGVDLDKTSPYEPIRNEDEERYEDALTAFSS